MQGGVAVGRDTGTAEVIDVGHLVGGIAHALCSGGLQIRDGGNGVDLHPATLEIGAAHIICTCLLTGLVCLGIQFESLGLVHGEILPYAVEVAQIAHGLAMPLVGGLLVIFDSLGAVSLQPAVAQLIIKAHLELTRSNIVIGQLLVVGDGLHVVDGVDIATCLITITHGIDGVDQALVGGTRHQLHTLGNILVLLLA